MCKSGWTGALSIAAAVPAYQHSTRQEHHLTQEQMFGRGGRNGRQADGETRIEQTNNGGLQIGDSIHKLWKGKAES
jgi:hypothetical protein